MARRRRSNGEGSIWWSEAQKLWAAELVLPDGKPKRKRSKRQSVVKEWLEAEKEAVRKGNWVSGGVVRYGDFLERYIDDLATHTLRPTTLVSYTHHIRKNIKPYVGDMKITNIRPEHLQRLYSDLLKKGLSKATVKYTHAVVRKTLGIALKWGLVGRNVAEAASPPTPDAYEIKPLTVSDVKKLLKVLEDDRLYAFYVLLVTSGVRLGEALGLQKQDLRLDQGTLVIKRSLFFVAGKGLQLGEPKSEKSNRELALPKFAVQILRDHLSKYSLNSNFVFSTGKGTPFSPRNIIRHFKMKLVEAGLPRETRIHDLRHSYISWLAASGVPVRDLQAIAGHAQASTTIKIYTHLLPGYNQDAAKKVEGMFTD